jgi:hypothetical protein
MIRLHFKIKLSDFRKHTAHMMRLRIQSENGPVNKMRMRIPAENRPYVRTKYSGCLQYFIPELRDFYTHFYSQLYA